MWKNVVEPEEDIIRRLRFACWITNATHILAQCVLLTTATVVSRTRHNVTLYYIAVMFRNACVSFCILLSDYPVWQFGCTAFQITWKKWCFTCGWVQVRTFTRSVNGIAIHSRHDAFYEYLFYTCNAIKCVNNHCVCKFFVFNFTCSHFVFQEQCEICRKSYRHQNLKNKRFEPQKPSCTPSCKSLKGS